ncbi:hypothetical protein [Paracoccus benzoatiresistens]|uniref:Uncharacterized protein n=1 Tax=Paracoccus benzoatiresistens TaxID=2997341 RepID=A0ABT4J822_9RHOB|nr:hypothetical protein [Paracoccus sp. EF6]MCZ0963273.1 hypothetical protein [Paracoccus sp. EF6]
MRLMFLVPLLLPLPAAAFTAQNGMTAVQTGPSEITVIHEVQRGDTDYWCAAGDFAQRVMRLPGKTPIWRASPKPRRGGEGIVFTLDPARAAEGAGLSQFGTGERDGSIPVAMAVGSFCRRFVPYWSD